MILQWNNAFDSAQMLWMLLATLILTVTLLPAAAVLLTKGRCLILVFLKPGNWITCVALNSAAWIMILYSLAFGPSAGTTPEVGTAEKPRPLEVMILEAANMTDQSHLFGRGGIIGDLQFAGFRSLESQGNADEPLFSSRRPHHHVSLIAYLCFQLVVYLCAVLTVGAIVSQSASPGRSLLYCVFWGACVYVPVAHWVWGDGWLAVRGAIDAGGGILMLVLGISALALARFRADRASDESDTSDLIVHVLVPASVALFWFGFVVFMCSLQMPSPHLRAIALMNGIVAPCAGFLLYQLLQYLSPERARSTSSLTGICCGLSAIAPGCMLFDCQTSAIIGIVGAVAGYGAWQVCNRRNSAVMLEFACSSAAASAIGLLAVGIFGNSVNGVFHWDKSPIRSLIHGEADLLTTQLLTVVCIGIYVFVLSTVLGWFILQSSKAPDFVLRTANVPTPPANN